VSAVTATPEPATAPTTARRGRSRRLLRVVALALAALFMVVTLASVAYNRATRGRTEPATASTAGLS